MQLVKAFFIHTHGAHCNHYYAFTIVKSIDNKSHNQLHITIYAFALKKNQKFSPTLVFPHPKRVTEQFCLNICTGYGYRT